MKKNILYRIGLILTIFIGVGCSDYLEVEPDSNWNVDEFYKTPTEATLGISGIYSHLASTNVYGQDLPAIFDSGTDEGYYNRRYNENWTVGLYRHTSADLYVKNLWASLYSCVNAANMFIEKLDKDGLGDQYNKFIAEARFLRALSYFHLVSWYGDVPLRLTYSKDQASNHVAPSEASVVYDQIIEDFKFAYQHLPHASDNGYVPGHANKMAAHGLLARAYLKMAGYPLQKTEMYEKAMAHCDSVMQDGWHQLSVSESDTLGYKNVFMTYIQNTYNLNESMFEISFTSLRDLGLKVDGKIGQVNGISWTFGGEGYPYGYAMLNVSPVVKNVYAAEDKRSEWNIAGYKNGGGNIAEVKDAMSAQYCPGKFRRWEPSNWADLDPKAKPEKGAYEPYVVLEPVTSPNKNYTGINFPVLRYSDILLMYAEAANEVNDGPTAEAIAALNQVRNRAGLGNIDVDVPSAVASHDAFLKELQDERMREFCFEGLRKQDLIRWGILGERLNYTNQIIQGDPKFKATNEQHVAYLRAGQNFDSSKHLTLPYPLQETAINNQLTQKENW